MTLRDAMGKLLCSIGLHWCKYHEIGAKASDKQVAEIEKMPVLVREQIIERMGGHTIRICTRCHCVQRSVLDTSGCLSITDPPSYYWETISN
jgi:hypothetical protein